MCARCKNPQDLRYFSNLANPTLSSLRGHTTTVTSNISITIMPLGPRVDVYNSNTCSYITGEYLLFRF